MLWEKGLLHLAWISFSKSRQWMYFIGKLDISIMRHFDHKLLGRTVQLMKMLSVDRWVFSMNSLAKRRFIFSLAISPGLFLRHFKVLCLRPFAGFVLLFLAGVHCPQVTFCLPVKFLLQLLVFSAPRVIAALPVIINKSEYYLFHSWVRRIFLSQFGGVGGH